MSSISTADYAEMANRVYNVDSRDPGSYQVPSFCYYEFREGMNWGLTNADFKGCVYPFVTFNAPGMWGDIQKAKFLAEFPRDQARSIAGTFKGSIFSKQKATTGRNFRNVSDPVSAYGSHYGSVTRFWGTGLHSMNDLLDRIKKSRWANINPFDPAYKEWGEL